MTGTPTNSSDRPIRSDEDLLRYFSEGAKERPRWGVGLEYERLGLDAPTGKAAAYSGDRGVEAVLRGMSERFGWKPDLEAGRIIGLERGDSHVTLEPGGQLELSGRVHPDIGRLRRELACFLRETAEVSGPLGIAWAPLGLQPLTPVEEIDWVPKGRYRIMAPYLGARGSLAHHMMKGTAGVQLNFDYGDEEDAVDKLRTAMAISPITTAASANSPLYAGEKTGFLSRRAHIWTDTDPERCGLPEFAYRDDLSFRAYMEHALDVPMLFLRRDGRWLDAKGIPFRRFLAEGWKGIRPVEADWVLHLTTIFTEVRLKTYVEVRGVDSITPSLAVSFAVFWKGLLYDDISRRRAWSLVSRFSWREHTAFNRDVAKHGPAARLGDATALDLARELLSLAREGLIRICGGSGVPPCATSEATTLLAPLEESLASEGGCPASRLLREWESRPRTDPSWICTMADDDVRAFLSSTEEAGA